MDVVSEYLASWAASSRSGGAAAAPGVVSCRFKDQHSLDKRRDDSQRIRAKYPDRIPVIVNKWQHCTTLPELDKEKFLVPGDLTIGQFIYIIRRRIRLSPEQAVFVFVNNALPPVSQTMAAIDADGRDQDGFLYFTYSSENTFGAGGAGADLTRGHGGREKI